MSRTPEKIWRALEYWFRNDPEVHIKSVEQRRTSHYHIKIDVDITPERCERFLITESHTPSGRMTVEQSVTRNLRRMLRQRLGE